jgi:hypothetical protein
MTRHKLKRNAMNLPFGLQITRSRPQPKQPEQRRSRARSQTRDAFADAYSSYFNAYQPLKMNMGLFTLIRSQIPFFNVAILKLVKLIGDPIIRAESESVQTLIDDFTEKVKVNNFGQGLGVWLDEIVDSTFETGMGWGELVLTESLTDIHSLKIANPHDLRFVKDKESGELKLATLDEDGWTVRTFENPDQIYYLAFDRRKGHPQGYSLIYSCVYPSQVFIRWEKGFENLVWRAGDPIYFAKIMGGEGESKPHELDQLRDSVMDELAEVMKARKSGKAKDLGVSYPYGGDADVKTLGSDIRLPRTDESVRTILEQLVANTGLLPVHLGISWATTERMSQIQQDILQSNIRSQRERITPIIRRIIDTALIVNRNAGAKYEIDWPPVTLMDETDKAEAKKNNMAALESLVNSLVTMIEMEMATQESAEEMLANEGFDVTKMPKDWFTKAKSKGWLRQMTKEMM